jgi:hypothetical protein
MNCRNFPVVGFRTIIPILIMMMEFGCEPLSVPQPPTDYDTPALINAYVAPDTVLVGEPFVVQVNYSVACNEQFVRFRLEDAGTHFTYTPIVHKYPEQNCSSTSTDTTAADTLQIDSAGSDTLIFTSQDFVATRSIVALAIVDRQPVFTLHFLFRDAQAGLSHHTTTFRRLDSIIDIPIQADSLGYWDTTFTDARSTLQYKIGTINFEATKGVKENGVIVIQ